MMWYALHHGAWGWGGMIFVLLFWVVVIGLIIWGAMRMRKHRCCMYPEHHGRALDIAGERYAKGEISKEEFEQIKKDLSG